MNRTNAPTKLSHAFKLPVPLGYHSCFQIFFSPEDWLPVESVDVLPYKVFQPRNSAQDNTEDEEHDYITNVPTTQYNIYTERCLQLQEIIYPSDQTNSDHTNKVEL